MLDIKCDIKSKIVDFHFVPSNMNNFHSPEVVDRASETQFQVGKISNEWFCG